jgi:hypothetical protein
VIALTELPAELASPNLFPHSLPTYADIVSDGNEHVIDIHGEPFRLHFDGSLPRSPAVQFPLDRLLPIRVWAVLRLWRAATGGQSGRNPGTLPKFRRDRLVLALRAIDGRAKGATYREIATMLFGPLRVRGRAWKSHDLRDRTIRLVRFGLGMTRSGYRRLLTHPRRLRS